MLLPALVACADAPPAPVDPCDEPGTVCTWMGLPGLAMLSVDGVHREASGLYMPQDVAFAPDGTAFVADFNNHRVQRVAPDGVVTTLAGTGLPGDGDYGTACWGGCAAGGYELWHPSHVALDPGDPALLYAAAWHNSRIDRVDLARDVLTWITGDGQEGYREGDAQRAQLNLPSSVVAADDGTLYLSDQANQMIRRVTPDGAVEAVAGVAGVAGFAGDGGAAAEALLHGHSDWVGGPSSKLDLRGRELLVADTMNGVIRRIDLDTGAIDRFAGAFVSTGLGFTVNPLDGTVHYGELGGALGYGGDGGPALEARFARPRDVAFGRDGEVYVADSGNHCVRVVRDGIVDTLTGTCGEEPGFAGDGGPAEEAVFDLPCGVAVDGEGHVYVADANNQVIRRVAAR